MNDELALRKAMSVAARSERNAQLLTVSVGTRPVSNARRRVFLFKPLEAEKLGRTILGLDSPFCSIIVLSKKRPFSLGFRRFSRKKDPWKEWGRYP